MESSRSTKKRNAWYKSNEGYAYLHVCGCCCCPKVLPYNIVAPVLPKMLHFQSLLSPPLTRQLSLWSVLLTWTCCHASAIVVVGGGKKCSTKSLSLLTPPPTLSPSAICVSLTHRHACKSYYGNMKEFLIYIYIFKL
jgi:hypothetical protein